MRFHRNVLRYRAQRRTSDSSRTVLVTARTAFLMLAIAAILSVTKSASNIANAQTTTTVGSFEAEAMTLSPSTGGAVFSDSSASGGKGLNIWDNATASRTQTLSGGMNQIIIRARGDQCSGAPNMLVKVNGTQVLSQAVSATSWTDYSAKLSSTVSGSAKVEISLTNDYYNWYCDRNLRLDKVTLSGTATSSGTTAYQGPLTITAGGTYTGNWQSTSASTPAVTVKTTAPVVIQNCNVKGPGKLISAPNQGADVTVRYCKGYGVNPNVSGKYKDRFFEAAYYPKRVIVENNYLEGTTGIKVNRIQSGGTAKVRYNKAKNIDGRASNGAGGYTTSCNKFHSQFAQFGQMAQPVGAEIAWNEVINEPYNSCSEDTVSLWQSYGTSSSPITVHDNFLKGNGYNANPTTGDSSGTGMVVGDGSATAFLRAYDNQIVSGQNAGIGIYQGHDNQYYRNRLVSSNLLPDGRQIRSTTRGVGGYVNNGTSASNWARNYAQNNVAGWKNQNGRNDYWFRSCSPSGSCTGNTSISGDITLATENAEYQRWLNKVAGAGVRVGP